MCVAANRVVPEPAIAAGQEVSRRGIDGQGMEVVCRRVRPTGDQGPRWSSGEAIRRLPNIILPGKVQDRIVNGRRRSHSGRRRSRRTIGTSKRAVRALDHVGVATGRRRIRRGQPVRRGSGSGDAEVPGRGDAAVPTGSLNVEKLAGASVGKVAASGVWPVIAGVPQIRGVDPNRGIHAQAGRQKVAVNSPGNHVVVAGGDGGEFDPLVAPRLVEWVRRRQRSHFVVCARPTIGSRRYRDGLIARGFGRVGERDRIDRASAEPPSRTQARREGIRGILGAVDGVEHPSHVEEAADVLLLRLAERGVEHPGVPRIARTVDRVIGEARRAVFGSEARPDLNQRDVAPSRVRLWEMDPVIIVRAGDARGREVVRRTTDPGAAVR